jgi:hypothetical protein
VVNFDTVQTDGMVSIKQENGNWVLRPYPRYRNFTVLLNAANFPMPTIVQTFGTIDSTVVPVARGAYWQLPLNDAKSYAWPANSTNLEAFQFFPKPGRTRRVTRSSRLPVQLN